MNKATKTRMVINNTEFTSILVTKNREELNKKLNSLVFTSLLYKDRPFLIELLQILNSLSVEAKGPLAFVAFLEQQAQEASVPEQLESLEAATKLLIDEENYPMLWQLRRHVNNINASPAECRQLFYRLSMDIWDLPKDSPS